MSSVKINHTVLLGKQKSDFTDCNVSLTGDTSCFNMLTNFNILSNRATSFLFSSHIYVLLLMLLTVIIIKSDQ